MPDLNFKQGLKENLLKTNRSDGTVYYVIDEDTFYIDRKDGGNGAVSRKQINANNAQTLSNASLEKDILSGRDDKIPSSYVVSESINNVYEEVAATYMTKNNPTGTGTLTMTGPGNINIGGGCTLSYDTTNKCLNFTF